MSIRGLVVDHITVQKPILDLFSPLVFDSFQGMVKPLGYITYTCQVRLFPFCTSIVSWSSRIHWLDLCRGVRPTLMSVQDMTLNNLMGRIQAWGSGEYEVPLHCHCSKVHFDPEWWHLIGSCWWVKLNCLTFRLCQKKGLMLNLIVRNRTVWSSNCVQTNDWCLIETIM